MEQRLKQIIAEVVDEKGRGWVECEIMPDHVHLLVGVDPQFGVHCQGFLDSVPGGFARF